MKQSRKVSLVEDAANVVVGYGLAVMVDDVGVSGILVAQDFDR